MKSKFWIYLFLALAAFRPLPASAQIKDAADKVLKTLEDAAAKASEAFKQVGAVQDEINKVKTGDFGINLGPFVDLKENFIKKKKLDPFKTPSYAQNDDAMAEAIGDALLPVYGQGGDTKASQQQTLNNLLVQHNNAAVLYSRALAMRVALAEEYKKKPKKINLKDGMAVLQAAKAYSEQINLRIVDIANLDAATSDLDNSRNLMSQSYYNMLAKAKEGGVDTSGDEI